jgi:hypothetical protein
LAHVHEQLFVPRSNVSGLLNILQVEGLDIMIECLGYQIKCDGLHFRLHCAILDKLFPTLTEAMDDAGAAGWVMIDGIRDIRCPECVAKLSTCDQCGDLFDPVKIGNPDFCSVNCCNANCIGWPSYKARREQHDPNCMDPDCDICNEDDACNIGNDVGRLFVTKIHLHH